MNEYPFTFQQLGVFGQRRSGKTTVLRHLSENFARVGRRTLYLNPTGEQFGPWSLSFRDPERFFARVWRERDCFVCIDEAGDTIRRNPDLSPLFTRIGHCGHLLAVGGHSVTQLLPVQRDQFDALALFLAGPKTAEALVEEWGEPRFRRVARLRRFEFLYCRKFGDRSTGRHLVEVAIARPG